jgi:DNA-binding MarR family transcriptional regulator
MVAAHRASQSPPSRRRTPASAGERLTTSEAAATESNLGTLTLLLGRVGRLNEVLATEVCQAHDVTLAEVRVLAALRDADGPLRPGVLSDRVVQTSGGLTATLRRLENDGRVRRTVERSDARVRAVELTAAGEAFVDEVLEAFFDRYGDVFGDLDIDGSLAVVRTLLARLERATRSRPSAAWNHTDQ